MKILSADTATSIITVAVCEDDEILAETTVRADRKHSERLMETVDWVLEESGLILSDIDALAISTGPGSFTGLRVGVATWKGLALGQGLPLVPVSTLDAMTRLAPFQDHIVCPMIDAKMGEVFGAVYHFDSGIRTKHVDDKVCSVEELLDGLSGEVIVFGDGAERYRERIEKSFPDCIFAGSPCDSPRASAVAIEAYYLIEQGIDSSPAAVSPVYLRKSQAEENRNRDVSNE